jgi:hypothetical protein
VLQRIYLCSVKDTIDSSDRDVKSLQGPQGTKKCGGMWCGELDALLLLEPMNPGSGKHVVFIAPKGLRGPPPCHDRQAAWPPRAGLHKP